MIKIRNDVDKIKNEIIKYRRQLHEIPEIGFQEFKTAKIISNYLTSFNINHRTEIGITGIIAEIFFDSGPVLAFRADMDGLPIQENNDFYFVSKNNGISHACGHDGHMAILLGVINILSKVKKTKYKGTIRFIFQPAEEGFAGALNMIDAGCLRNVDEIYGLHLWNYQPIGEIGVKEGPITAIADKFTITVIGEGGHGAAPQGTKDSVLISSQLVLMLQSIISRNINPIESAVLSVGKINGGSNFNIIANEVIIQGTVRAYKPEIKKIIKKRILEIIRGLEISFNCKIVLDYDDKMSYPSTINHLNQVKKVLKASNRVILSGKTHPYLSMVGEDFSYYLEKVPGCFFFVGSGLNNQKTLERPHHSAKFDFDEKALLIGTSIFLNLIDDILSY